MDTTTTSLFTSGKSGTRITLSRVLLIIFIIVVSLLSFVFALNLRNDRNIDPEGSKASVSSTSCNKFSRNVCLNDSHCSNKGIIGKCNKNGNNAVGSCVCQVIDVQRETANVNPTPPIINVLDNCSTPLNVQISSDGRTPSSTINLPINQPTKYYLHVKGANGKPCSTNFEVNSNDKITTDWGPYKSDGFGLARIDLIKGWPVIQQLPFTIRPKGSNGVWSNSLTINFNSQISGGTALDTRSYFKQKPGNVYIYNSHNHWYSNPGDMSKKSSYPGLTYLQIEMPINMCGRAFIPWRFTKDNEYAYWGNKMPQARNGSDIYKGDRDLRWYIADYNTSDGIFSQYSNYIWSYGFDDYQRDATNGMKNFPLGKVRRSYVFKTENPAIPHYNLGRKVFPYLPYIELNQQTVGFSKTDSSITGSDCNLILNPGTFASQGGALGAWMIRADMDNISISNPGIVNGFNYSGPALRIDYFEGQAPLFQKDKWFHRESFYYVQNIGLVKMLADNFNHYANVDDTVAPYCENDSDCLADTISNPTRSFELKQYFDNPSLSVAVSTDNVNYYSEITIQRGQRYYLKVTNTPYTGWLEAQLLGGQSNKWLWAQDGVVTVDENIMRNVPAGKYIAKYRIWIPNETFTNQPRIGVNTEPMSNQIIVNVM